MSLRPDETLLVALARLSEHAPHQWAEFVTALDGYAQKEAYNVVQANPEKVHVCQGRAQAFFDMLTMTRDCRAIYGKIRDAKRV